MRAGRTYLVGNCSSFKSGASVLLPGPSQRQRAHALLVRATASPVLELCSCCSVEYTPADGKPL